MLTIEHIRHARLKQLADLLGTYSQIVLGWERGARISQKFLDRALKLGIPQDVFLAGLKARHEDFLKNAQFQQEIDEFLMAYQQDADNQVDIFLTEVAS